MWPIQLLASRQAAEKLNDFQVYKINSSQSLEPSGLTFKGKQLYMVSDNTSAIFKLSFTNQKHAIAEAHQQLDDSQLSTTNLDLEGITVVDEKFFVVSELHHKLIAVYAEKLAWVPEFGGVYAEAFEFGLFQLFNAGIEAVTYLGDHTFLLAIERQPRGLIEVTFDANFKNIVKQSNQFFDSSKYPPTEPRHPDLTGLYYHDEVIYALHRNAYLIHELIKDQQGVYQEGRAWSYEHIVRSPDYAYQDMQFGHAEGLAVDDDYFYIVIDNNHNPSLKNPNDKRPLLIRAKRK